MYAEEMVQVIDIIEEDHSIQKLQTTGGTGRAILYKVSCSRAEPGDDILVNITAGNLRLGTGGWDIVISIKGKIHEDQADGHIMKARYTSSQHSVRAVDDPNHPDYHVFHSSFHLEEQPVLIAELHSMLPIILGAAVMKNTGIKVGIILSDEASLSAGLSDHMRIWKSHPNVQIVTTGQAFGGNVDTVTIPNALQWLVNKKHTNVLVISMGPGTVGTATPFGFSGIALAQWANITGALGGKPVWVPRISFEEKRERHFGISHHTLTAIEKFTYASSCLVLPKLKCSQDAFLRTQVSQMCKLKKHTIVYENSKDLLDEWKKWSKTYPIPITTMGKEVITDEAYILGVLAAVKYITRITGP